ncbi:hypothetical protein Tco_1015165 [Tanacetum coccineum]|uniref:Uncharacterized protein n=1 Tax=Tanacetum coccineum TaxID=301880 RepID=A0ABQ5FK43_9ASTR
MDTLSLVSEYLKDLKECMDDGDSRVAKEAKLFNALEHKSVVIEVDNQKITIFTKAPLRAFGEPFIRYSLPCKVDGQGAWNAELDLADSVNYVTEKVLENIVVLAFRMGTLSLVSEYMKDLEECMDDGDSRVVPLRAFGESFMRYSLPCKVDGQGAWDADLDLADSANYVMKKVLENIGFVHVILSDYGRKMVNDVNIEIYRIKFKADFVVLDYVNEGEPSILFGRDFLATTKSQVDFGLGEIRMNLTKFEEGIDVIHLLEEVGSSSEEVVKMGKANCKKAITLTNSIPLLL